MKLSQRSLEHVAAGVRRPGYAFSELGIGIIHLGLGAFHRAHQAAFTDEAVEQAGGRWGILGVSMRSPTVAQALQAQDGLYSIETLDELPRYRIIGCIRRTLTAALQSTAVIDAFADPGVAVVTVTVTEKGYCLNGAQLDLQHPDIVHDLQHGHAPRSLPGLLLAGLARRHTASAAPLTVISCDNLAANGQRLQQAIATLAEHRSADLADWIHRMVSFPQTMVDCIVPAANPQSLARAARALAVADAAAVQREPYSEWVIEDRFAGPIPAWAAAGAQIVASVDAHRRLKLHVLNATHSALAYLGLARGHELVREAIADPALAQFLEGLVASEIAPALPDLPVQDYWARTRRRFANPRMDYRLAQVAEDGAAKLAERVFPLLIDNVRAGRPAERLARIVRAWMARQALPPEQQLQDAHTFPEALRSDPALRRLLLDGPS